MRISPISFEEKYFTKYYKKNVGAFTLRDLNKSKNWFYGWLWYLQKFVDMKNGKGKRVLEIGCSIGGVSHLLWERGFEVYSGDVSKYVIAKAKKLSLLLKRGIKFYNFNIEKEMTFREKFDIIIAFEVIEHLRNPLNAIVVMKKRLNKKGILICSTPNLPYDASSDPTHINVKSKKEWESIFKKAGFENVKLRQVSFLPFFYKFSKYFHIILPIAIRSKYINSPLFIIARN
jgi:2-polyprenyl-3-methyl-5-hydroxy-6-metoxy-1,4-benzoquinol methylase